MNAPVRTGPDPRYLPPGSGYSKSWACSKCKGLSGVFAGRKLTARGYVCRRCTSEAKR